MAETVFRLYCPRCAWADHEISVSVGTATKDPDEGWLKVPLTACFTCSKCNQPNERSGLQTQAIQATIEPKLAFSSRGCRSCNAGEWCGECD